MIIKPREHQSEFMGFHRDSRMLGSLAWHGMGLGKTLSTLWLAQEQLVKLRKQGVKAPKFMVIVPKSAVSTWKVECHKHTPGLTRDMVIYPYSQLHNAIKMLKMIDVRLLAFDESHYLKSPNTNRVEMLSNFLRELEKVQGRFEQGRLLLLTGTPMPNSAAELYTSWAMCCAPTLTEAANRLQDPARFEDWKRTFSNKKEVAWTIGKKRPKGQQRRGVANKWEGVANEEMLQQLLKPFVHYKRVEDCIDIPPKVPISIDLGLADDKLLANANIEEPEAYMALLERLARAKTPHMIDWVEDFLEGSQEQLVVFAMNRYPIEELREKFPKHVRLITGAEKNEERAQNLKDFQDGKYRVLAMTYKAGSESLNCQNAHYALYHGYPWTDDTLQQAMARIYRSGQIQKTMHYFLTSGENDIKILNIILGKAEATNKVKTLLTQTNVSLKKILKLDELI